MSHPAVDTPLGVYAHRVDMVIHAAHDFFLERAACPTCLMIDDLALADCYDRWSITMEALYGQVPTRPPLPR